MIVKCGDLWCVFDRGRVVAECKTRKEAETEESLARSFDLARDQAARERHERKSRRFGGVRPYGKRDV